MWSQPSACPVLPAATQHHGPVDLLLPQVCPRAFAFAYAFGGVQRSKMKGRERPALERGGTEPPTCNIHANALQRCGLTLQSCRSTTELTPQVDFPLIGKALYAMGMGWDGIRARIGALGAVTQRSTRNMLFA